jgi:FrmR/RcnR family transcriptional regulator, repressor of frmRAB operon
MAHTVRDKEKLLKRVKRVIGQVEAVKRGLENEEDCADIMMLISAARGAMNSLMAEVVKGTFATTWSIPIADRRPRKRVRRRS